MTKVVKCYIREILHFGLFIIIERRESDVCCELRKLINNNNIMGLKIY